MSETQNTTDSRQESNRVTTQESIVASLSQPPASEAPAKQEEAKQDDANKGKKSAQDRIREAIDRRNKAEEETREAKREAAELRARLEAMDARAKPMEETAKPVREQFANDDDYIDALTEYKAKQAIQERERAQQQARMEAETAEIVAGWNRRQEQAAKDIPDYAEVVGAADVPIAPHVQQVIVESEMGPHLAYYFALNQDELKKLNGMRPVQAVRHIMSLERELREDSEPTETSQKTQRSKAPEPISPVKDATAANPGPASSFEEYKRRRKAAQGK